MAHNSNSIESNPTELLSKVRVRDIDITRGYLRESKVIIPSEIVDYIIIYAFLFINEWFKGGEHWVIGETKLIATRNAITEWRHSFSFSTIYANPEISRGKYEWKVKILSGKLDHYNKWLNTVYIGISSEIRDLNHAFYGMNGVGATSYAYLNVGHVMDHTMPGSKNWPSAEDPVSYDEGDVITVHLDLDQATVGFSKNDEFIGVAFDNIDTTKSYRLAVSPSSDNKWEFELVC